MPCTPMLAYSARGIATLWESATPPAPHAIAGLLGRTRAALLAALDQPTSTTHLAQRLSLIPGAISQHLTVLNDCGLVAGTRIGRSVLYRQTRAATCCSKHNPPRSPQTPSRRRN
jgi:DNA-binding transcriptional ArsR family regulator